MKKKLIGKGNTAQVYDIGDGKVLKLFVRGYPKKAVEQEFHNAMKMQAFGISIPVCYEMIKFFGRNGIVYEKVEGCNLETYVAQNNAPEEGLNILSSLQKQFFNHECAELISYKDFIKIIIGNRNPQIIQKIDKLPDGLTVCHGDFHPQNILVDEKGVAKVIDFMNVCKGPKEYDIARTFYLICGDKSLEEAESEEEKEIISNRIMFANTYLQKHEISKKEIEPFIEIVKICHKYEML